MKTEYEEIIGNVIPENGGCNIGKYIENTLTETNSEFAPEKKWFVGSLPSFGAWRPGLLSGAKC